ncbi:MAG: glycogen debranching protein GlgX [Lachnospiraceae bacterium]|nr:glycogen debranching protein GlgX [Lachnospiraceae bacterium]
MELIDSFPTNKIKDLEYRVGRVFPFGATVTDGGVNFSVYSNEATSCTLVLFKHGQKKPYVEIPFPDSFKIGNVYTMLVFGLNIENIEYGYRFDGEYNPEKGLCFDKTKILLDPYAKSVTGRSVWGEKDKSANSKSKKTNSKNNIQEFIHRGQIIREDYDWEGDSFPQYAQKDLCIYEMHVRSFTRDESCNVKHKGTFSGIVEQIPYLKKLGVNCVELMPIFEFDEFENAREYKGQELFNYWGYSTLCFFAPKAGYAVTAPNGMEADELKNLVKKLHKNGIEVILDVVFNHTAEGNEMGPCISYRGIDNRTYYLLDEAGKYYNFSGCGNTLNCNDAVVRNMIKDCLRYWVSSYHIDGFRFDLASIMTRDESGEPMLSPPLLQSIAHDPVLGKTKLIAEAWDAGGLYQVGSFPAWNRWAEWNGRYRDCVRDFLKGDCNAASELFYRICGSPDLYGERGAQSSVNFITCHDGFTLWDLVSYNEKHNESNGEDNRDGTNDNHSWNCGVEGETEDKEINALRNRQVKNALTILFTSRGVPMLLSGDEFANTQFGNNNAYCQDNEISWLDWNNMDKHKDIFKYVSNLIDFRKAHPVLKNTSFDMDRNQTDYPELSFHSENAWQFDTNTPYHSIGYMYVEEHNKYKTKGDAFIYIGLNSFWGDREMELPIVPADKHWHVAFDSFNGKSYSPGREKPFENSELIKDGRLLLRERSSAVLIAK